MKEYNESCFIHIALDVRRFETTSSQEKKVSFFVPGFNPGLSDTRPAKQRDVVCGGGP